MHVFPSLCNSLFLLCVVVHRREATALTKKDSLKVAEKDNSAADDNDGNGGEH